MKLLFFLWPKLGLILNFIGTILVAISVRKNPAGAYQMDDKDKDRKFYLVVFYPIWFRVGLSLLALGFLFNLFIF